MPKDLVLCDLDGTAASVEWRRHFVEQDPKDWKSFFAGIPFDPPVPAVRSMLRDYVAEGCEVIYVSARPADYRKVTSDWLHKHGFPRGKLLMRASGDFRPDEQVKQELLDTQLPKERIRVVVDDRPKVLQMWSANGLETIKVVDPGLEPTIAPRELGTPTAKYQVAKSLITLAKSLLEDQSQAAEPVWYNGVLTKNLGPAYGGGRTGDYVFIKRSGSGWLVLPSPQHLKPLHTSDAVKVRKTPEGQPMRVEPSMALELENALHKTPLKSDFQLDPEDAYPGGATGGKT